MATPDHTVSVAVEIQRLGEFSSTRVVVRDGPPVAPVAAITSASRSRLGPGAAVFADAHNGRDAKERHDKVSSGPPSTCT